MTKRHRWKSGILLPDSKSISFSGRKHSSTCKSKHANTLLTHVYMCTCVVEYILTHVYVHACAKIRRNTHTHTHTHTHTCSHTHTPVHEHVNKEARIHYSLCDVPMSYYECNSMVAARSNAKVLETGKVKRNSLKRRRDITHHKQRCSNAVFINDLSAATAW